MRTRLSLLFVFLLVFGVVPSFAQKGKKTKPLPGPSEKLSGQLQKKPWTKSTQSYCAGGSEYFVIKTSKEEIVLENQSGLDLATMSEKQVEITGKLVTRKVKAPEDENLQRPIQINSDGKDTGEFTCRVFTVKNIRLKKN